MSSNVNAVLIGNVRFGFAPWCYHEDVFALIQLDADFKLSGEGLNFEIVAVNAQFAHLVQTIFVGTIQSVLRVGIRVLLAGSSRRAFWSGAGGRFDINEWFEIISMLAEICSVMRRSVSASTKGERGMMRCGGSYALRSGSGSRGDSAHDHRAIGSSVSCVPLPCCGCYFPREFPDSLLPTKTTELFPPPRRNGCNKP